MLAKKLRHTHTHFPKHIDQRLLLILQRLTWLAMVELIDDHIQHVKSCTLDACFRCLYIRNQHKWKKKLPWLTDRMWKSCSHDNDDELVWGLGCRICIRAGLSSSSLFASSGFGEDAGGFHGFSSVMRHTRSKAHQKAVKQLNCEDGSNEAPSEEQFGQFMKERFSSDFLDSLSFFIVLMLNTRFVLIVFRSFHLPRNDTRLPHNSIVCQGLKRSSLNFHLPGLGGRKKLTKMQRCVGLACEAIDLTCLKEAGSIVLHQDVSRGILVVTFSACSKSLQVARGFLGCEELPPAQMESLQTCTRDILLRACAGDRRIFNLVRSKVVA